jgi:hypothetical protein
MKVAHKNDQERRTRSVVFYLLRGRLHEHLGITDLNEMWTATFKTMFLSRLGEDIQAHYDSGAELDLRGMQAPVETIRAEIETLGKERRGRLH